MYSDRINAVNCTRLLMPLPQEKTSQLIDEINSMVGKELTEDFLRDIAHGIHVLEKSGFYADAKQLEGMVAGLRKDVAGVHAKFHAALTNSGGASHIKANYAHALANAKLFREAVGVIDELVHQTPDDPESIRTAFEIHMGAYDYEGCQHCLELLRRLGREDLVSETLHTKLAEITEVMESSGATWNQVSERLETAYKVLIDQEIHVPRFAELFSEDMIHVELDVVGGIETAVLAEKLIHQKIASLPYSPADSILSIACLPE